MATTNQIKAYIAWLAPLCQRFSKEYGYKICSPAIAQALQESLGKSSQPEGLSTLAYKYNNFYGLKAGSSWLKSGKPSISMKTGEEYTPGVITQISDYFRVFPDRAAGVEGYYQFLQYDRYKTVKPADTPSEYLNAIKASGYCTSSTYVKNCLKKIETYNLTQYDSGSGSSVTYDYQIGRTYSTLSDLYVRNTPAGDHLDLSDLTEDGRRNAFYDAKGAILRKRTRVTVKETADLDGALWVRIPSGWICARGKSGTTYIA